MPKYGDLRRALTNKLLCEEAGAKEIKYRLYVGGKLVATTSLPKEKGHGKSEIGKGLFRCIARQLYIGDDQLNDIVRCVASPPGYLQWFNARARQP